jgi:ribonucleotide monophosphatase NagD (HAD superfamily)
MPHTIAVDLDGVIHAYSKGWNDGTMYDVPVPGSREALEKLTAHGFRVVIVTARMNPKFPAADKQEASVREWLGQNGFKEGEHYHELTNNKPAAIAYIDDRAVVFTDWEQAIIDAKKLVPN